MTAERAPATPIRPIVALEPVPTDEAVTEPGASPQPAYRLSTLGGYTMMFAIVTVLTKAVSFIMLPVYTRYMTPADYGAMELIELSFDILTMVAGARLLSGVFRYYYKADSDQDRRTTVSTGTLIMCGGYFAVGLGALLAAAPLARLTLGDVRYVGLMRIGALALSTSVLATVPPAFLRLQGRFRSVVVIQLVRLAIQVSLNVLFLVHFGLGPRGIFLSTLVANVTVGGTMMVMVLRPVGLHFSRRVAMSLYRFGGPLIAMQAATFILTFGDRYFLRATTNLTRLGTYTLAYQFAFALAMLTQTPFNLVWEPKRFEIAKRPDRDAIYARVFVYFNLALLTLALAIAMFVHDVLHLIATPPFFIAADVVPILLIAIILQGWANAQDLGILMAERTGYLASANWLGAIVTLAAYAILIPRYATWGAAISTVIGYTVRYACTYRFSQRLWPVHYAWRPVILLIGLVMATYGVSRLIPYGPLVFALPARVMLFLAYVVVLWWSPVLSTADRLSARRFLADMFTRFAAAIQPRAVTEVARRG